MKKRISFCLLLLLAALFLSAFALSENAWERDPNMHWHEDENGVRTDEGAHALNDIMCEICQSCILVYDDGMCDVSNYNEYDELTRYSYYDADGGIIDDYVYVYEYDENGVKRSAATYYFDALVEVSEYGLDPFGFSVQKSVRGFNDDGTESAYLCDEYGNIVSAKVTNAEGEVIFDEAYTYTYDKEGMPVYTIQKSVFEDGSVFYLETDAMGNRVIEAQYNPDGSLVYEYKFLYEYDEHGRMTKEITTEDGAPIFESRYAYSSDPYDLWGYQCMTIDYFEDGSKIVSELDEFGDIIKETTYDADGSIAS